MILHVVRPLGFVAVLLTAASSATEAARRIQFFLKFDVLHKLQSLAHFLADIEPNTFDIHGIHKHHVVLGVSA